MRRYKKFLITYAVIIVSFAGSLLLPCGMSGPGLPANNNEDSADISNVHLMTYDKIYLFIFLSVTYTIGACRAVWVPRQDLATPGFDEQLQHILSLHCTLYLRPCVRKHAYTIYRGLGASHMSSRLVLVIWEPEITWAMPRYARACRRLWLTP